MRQGNMLIHRRCRLRSAAAVRDLEIEGCNSMLAEGALNVVPPFIGLVV
jgi:hypothetical protein